MKLFNHPPALSACLALLPVLILLAACQSGASLSAAATPANVVWVGYFANSAVSLDDIRRVAATYLQPELASLAVIRGQPSGT